MPDYDRPTVSFRQTWRGYEGTILCGDDEISEVSNFSITRPKYAYGENWTLRLSVREATHQVRARLRHCDPDDLYFTGQTYSGDQITAHLLGTRAPGIPLDYQPPETEFQAISHQVDVGVSPLPEAPSEQSVVAILSEHTLMRKQLGFLVPRHTGEITPMADLVDTDTDESEVPRERDPLYWSTSYGRGQLWLRYTWENVLVAGRESRTRIPEPRLELDVPEEHLTQNIPDLLEGIREDLECLVRFLSLLSRRHVRCLELTVRSEWDEGRPDQRRITRRIWSIGPSTRDEFLDPVILQPMRIPETGLGDLRSTLDQIPYSDALNSTIGFLIETFRAEYVEAQWMAAFTALETIVGGLARTHGFMSPLDDPEYYRLTGKLRAFIDEYEPENEELTSEDRENLKRMLGALRRAPFSVRATKAVEKAGVQWQDLWPPDADLEEAIRAAYGRRSNLIHSGELPTDRDWYVDQFRMHALAERLVLNALDVPESWLEVSPYSHCAGLPGQPI